SAARLRCRDPRVGHVGQRQFGVERGHLHASEHTGRRQAVVGSARTADPSAQTQSMARFIARGAIWRYGMQIGLMAPQGWKGDYDGWPPADAWARTVELARQAESLGFESLWVFDPFHSVPEPTAEIHVGSFC